MTTNRRYFTWDDFVAGFGAELRSAGEIHQSMVAKGLKDHCLAKLDFTFVSDEEAKLGRLRDFLLSHYPYSVTTLEAAAAGWELSGQTDDLPITADNLKYWVLDMYKRGYEFDARLEAYGALFDPQGQRFPPLDPAQAERWFDRGMKAYAGGNLSGAIVSWSLVLAIDPADVNALYSRAIVKNELHAWKAAMRDYDAALAIAPTFLSALLNRGSLKDDNGDHQGAIADYDKVIALGADEPETARSAIFNRGNSKLSLKDRPGACADWKKALSLGEPAARARIDEHCGR